MSESQSIENNINENHKRAFSPGRIVVNIANQFRKLTIRRRLFVAFILLALLPAITFSAVSIVVGFRSGRQQVINQLQSVATLKEAELNTWISSLRADMAALMVADGVNQHMNTLLSQSPELADYQIAYDQLQSNFSRIIENTPRLDELFLMNLDRRVVLSTDVYKEGRPGGPGSLVYFQKGLEGEYLHPPAFTYLVGGIAVLVVHPVLTGEGEVVGILVGRAGPTRLSEIMLERTGLGNTGETYLVTRQHVMLTKSRFSKGSEYNIIYVFSEGAIAALKDHMGGSGTYTNYRGDRVIGIYHWLPELQVALLAEQSESEALKAIYSTLGINVGVATAVLLGAGLVSLILAQSIVTPLAGLVNTATQVSAGDLTQTANENQTDEIGMLARAFNSMTAQLRGLIDNLELRIIERTRALHRRALQLETSAKVSREIISILDIDLLLIHVVKLIRDTFDYYQVQIFLVDKDSQQLVMRASTSQIEPIIRFLAIDQQSLIGTAALANKSLMVNDVAQDPRFLVDERLPDTQSELVIPLRIGDRVIGTLDVQSMKSDAFTSEDMLVIQSLGDQVAVAIENAGLYKRSQALAVLEERNRIARDLHDSVTQSLYSLHLFAGAGLEILAAGDRRSVKEELSYIAKTAQQALNEMRLLVYELRPPALEQEGLVGALDQRMEAVERRLGKKAHLLLEGEIDLRSPLEEEFYHITQEALNNALKHASAATVTVKIRSQNNQIELEVVDDGIGFDYDSASGGGGLGLIGMKERVERLGGSFAVFSTPGNGTRIMVTAIQAPSNQDRYS
ncbi:MAG: GAF domain-containing protein [Anaerolineales bacterium]|nr:GAF domain-containing protein [Anaerolineales bacterium]